MAIDGLGADCRQAGPVVKRLEERIDGQPVFRERGHRHSVNRHSRVGEQALEPGSPPLGGGTIRFEKDRIDRSVVPPDDLACSRGGGEGRARLVVGDSVGDEAAQAQWSIVPTGESKSIVRGPGIAPGVGRRARLAATPNQEDRKRHECDQWNENKVHQYPEDAGQREADRRAQREGVPPTG